MDIIILLGAPGSGKGTLAQRLTQLAPSMRHLSSGDLLRDAVKSETPAGRQAKAAMDRGELVPDTLIGEMIRDFLAKADPSATYLLDGFPRTRPQADMLDAILRDSNATLRAAVLLDTPEDILLDRITGRRVCPACKTVYHVTTLQPATEGHCDTCNAPLIQRDDDKPETVKHRLAVYNETTAPLIDLYARRQKLITLPANGSADAIADAFLAALPPAVP